MSELKTRALWMPSKHRATEPRPHVVVLIQGTEVTTPKTKMSHWQPHGPGPYKQKGIYSWESHGETNLCPAVLPNTRGRSGVRIELGTHSHHQQPSCWKRRITTGFLSLSWYIYKFYKNKNDTVDVDLLTDCSLSDPRHYTNFACL